jgi:hypothetical protein
MLDAVVLAVMCGDIGGCWIPACAGNDTESVENTVPKQCLVR